MTQAPASEDGTAAPSHSLCLVVMGVAGAGKSTLAAALGARLGVPYVDADAYHPPANVEKMKSGQALTDDDRAGWLAALRAVLDAAESRGEGVVLACSALKSAYRGILGVPSPRRFLIYIDIDPETARRRVSRRVSHFMPTTLVDSQFATLEVPADAIVVQAAWPLHRAVSHVRSVVYRRLEG